MTTIDLSEITLVTVTIYAEECCESYSCEVGSVGCQTVEDAIRCARDEAMERFDDDLGPLPPAHRIIVHVDRFPAPKNGREIIIPATLPELAAEEPVMAAR